LYQRKDAMTGLSSEKIRESQIVIPGCYDRQQIGNGAPFGEYSSGDSVFRSTERLILGNSPAMSRNPNGTIRYSGQPFQTSTCRLSVMAARFQEDFLYNSSLNWRMLADGWFVPNIGQGANTLFNGLDADFIATEAWGTRGWHRYAPNPESSSLAVFLAELRDFPTIPHGIKDFHKTITDNPKWLGKDYLNYAFGWKPLIRDIRSFYKTSNELDARLRQLARDNGQPVRRGGPIHTDTTTSVVESSGTGYPTGLWPPINASHFVGPWKKTVTQSLTVSYWFSARFRYYIPDLGTKAWEDRAGKLLYGSSLTPSTVYQLLPWTWALDWHTNIGDTIANFSAQPAENLTADYAYVMEHRRIDTQTVYQFATHSGPKTCSVTMEQESKYRLPASPFGFGVTWDGFSPKQVAIMAALGVTRS